MLSYLDLEVELGVNGPHMDDTAKNNIKPDKLGKVSEPLTFEYTQFGDRNAYRRYPSAQPPSHPSQNQASKSRTARRYRSWSSWVRSCLAIPKV